MVTRRHLMWSAGATAFLAGAAHGASRAARVPPVEPLPLHAVRLKPSIFLDAVEANRSYLLALDPDRLLHNFHVSAGLPAKGPLYGGWEARGIAGHSLGHYLRACALMFAQTGDQRLKDRAGYIAHELARCQAAHGDGYVGGTTVERDGRVQDGKVVFEEIRRGDFTTGGFDVNGGWVPLYTWHKVHAGLLEAARVCGDRRALGVAVGMADYLGTIVEALDDAELQRLLNAEHGGLNEAYAETYALTGDRRWLALADRIRHRAVLDPLADGRNILPGLHANTQIPKVIGLARLYELTGNTRDAETARFFHRVVTGAHSYVIGGHSERELFRAPGVIAGALNDRTCESCNSYNMLKLTRHLFSWEPDGRLFDYYERTHLNHIMAHQHPGNGRFAYFMPLASGARRTWSTPEDTFWCCVGTGMESHAKHGDSVYWHSGGERLFVNLFVPSVAEWSAGGMRLTQDTRFPLDDRVRLTVEAAPEQARTLAVRLPGWCRAPRLTLNGAEARFEQARGYALIRRTWRAGDALVLHLPMTTRIETAPDDPRTVAYLRGPLVLASDMGPAAEDLERPAPALVEVDPAAALTPVAGEPFHHRLATGAETIDLRPFFAQYERRTAVYFPVVSRDQWSARVEAFRAEQRQRRRLDARSVDVVRLGEAPDENAHGFSSNHSDVIAWGGRNGRQAWWGNGNYIAFELAVAPGPLLLRLLYWGEEIDKHFEILVEGRSIATERRPGPAVQAFVPVDYRLPADLVRGRQSIGIRIETRGSDAPVYECRVLEG